MHFNQIFSQWQQETDRNDDTQLQNNTKKICLCVIQIVLKQNWRLMFHFNTRNIYCHFWLRFFSSSMFLPFDNTYIIYLRSGAEALMYLHQAQRHAKNPVFFSFNHAARGPVCTMWCSSSSLPFSLLFFCRKKYVSIGFLCSLATYVVIFLYYEMWGWDALKLPLKHPEV